MKFTCKLAGMAAVLFGVMAWASPVLAQQAYPNRNIRLVVPFGPGGGTDQAGRLVAQILNDAFKTPVVVENRPGASGIIGTENAGKSAPDGYTLLVTSPQELTINQHLFAKLPYAPERDFTAVTMAVTSPLVLVVHPSVAAQSVRELIGAARARPGDLTFASAGTGSPGHLAGELLNVNEKINIRHIPYKGAAPALTDLLGGQVHMSYLGLAVALPHLKSGKLRALAVTTAKRSPFATEIPTMQESGVSDYEISNWFGVFVPAGVPAEIVNRLNTTIAQGLANPEVRARLAQGGAEPVGNSAADFQRYVRTEIAKYRRVVEAAGVKLD